MSKTERDEMEREAYDEMRFEMRGEGLSVGTFEEWKAHNARIARFILDHKARARAGTRK